MWAVEGLTHRYPTKVLAELIPTCPQYCGHCTRMDLVGNDTPQVLKYKFERKQPDRWDAMLDYLARTPSVRDVVVSGGDLANVPIKRLQEWLFKLMDLPNIRDVRLATKGLMGIPQHFLQDEVLAGYAAIAKRAREREIEVAVHTHVNSARQVTPLLGRAVRALLDMGYRAVRNQGVLLRGVNTTPNQLLELCFMLMDHAKVVPYYFYLCDMIPNAEHWRLALWEAQALQMAIMGYLPGFSTPRFICDVAFVGKRWVHMVDSYDRVNGISYWRKNYRTGIEYDDPEALSREYPAYDPISSLPEEGREYWRRFLAAQPGRRAEPA
jgi:lysine 2,3-aminomutase